MRLLSLSLSRPLLTPTHTPLRVSFARAMSDIAQFVAAATKADTGLAADAAAVSKASAEVQAISSDLKVRCRLWSYWDYLN